MIMARVDERPQTMDSTKRSIACSDPDGSLSRASDVTERESLVVGFFLFSMGCIIKAGLTAGSGRMAKVGQARRRSMADTNSTSVRHEADGPPATMSHDMTTPRGCLLPCAWMDRGQTVVTNLTACRLPP
jgi:hypothetical protein